VFLETNGLLTSLQSGTTELLAAPLTPHFWRAPVDNDRGNKMPDKLGVWRRAHESFEAKSVRIEQPTPDRVEVNVDGWLAAVKSPCHLAFTVHGDGVITVHQSFEPGADKLPELPRFGMQTMLRAGFDQVMWLGKGPHETYSDRQDARVDVYRGTVAQQFFPYIKQGETGNKVGVRWIALTNKSGAGLLAVGDPLLSANALHFTTEDLFVATHKENRYPWQMPKRDTITLNLDLGQRGVGGDNSWSALPHAPFLIQPAKLDYTYHLRVLPPGKASLPELTAALRSGR
jgi:beta-galactosidase